MLKLTLCTLLLMTSVSADVPTTEAPVTSLSSKTANSLATRIDRMSTSEQLELYLGTVRSGKYLAGGAKLRSSASRLRRLERDPALAPFARIEARWIAEAAGSETLFETSRELVQAKVMVARNLYFQGVEPSARTVAREVEHILEQRRRFATTSLFEGRDVVFAASADRTRDSRKRNLFGRAVTQSQIERTGGRLTFFQSPNGREKAGLRRQLSREVASGSAPLTFVFEGHGRPEALKFGGSFGANDIAQMIAERSASGESAIVIASACDVHTLMRTVMQQLESIAPDAPRPIFVVPVEYGQQLVRPVFNDRFLSSEVGLATRTASLANLVARADLDTSVYVPDANNVVTQVL